MYLAITTIRIDLEFLTLKEIIEHHSENSYVLEILSTSLQWIFLIIIVIIYLSISVL